MINVTRSTSIKLNLSKVIALFFEKSGKCQKKSCLKKVFYLHIRNS